MFRDPETEKREDDGAAEQMDARETFVAPGEEEKKRVGGEDEPEEQRGARRDGVVSKKKAREAQGDESDGGPSPWSCPPALTRPWFSASTATMPTRIGAKLAMSVTTSAPAGRQGVSAR